MKRKVTMIDPPEGWKYGFPKEFPDGVTKTADWLIEQGYPHKLIAKMGDYFSCRYWTEEVDDGHDTTTGHM